MFRKAGHLLVLIAFLSAIGTHWFVLQSVAWTKMLADNLRDSSVLEAVQRTFDPTKPCCLCKQIAKGKQEQKNSEFNVEGKKLEFSVASHLFIFSPPTFCWQVQPRTISAISLKDTPPVPPPESLLG